MLRVVLINILLFVAPFAIYAGYVYFVKGQTERDRFWTDAPIVWLFAAGAFLVVAVMVSFVSFSTGDPEDTYRPAIMKDGKIAPGRIEPK